MDKKETRALTRNLRISPFRARLVIDLIRVKDALQAQTILSNTNKKAARLILKTLNSAIANAKENLNIEANNLYVKEARIDMGATLKRHKFDSRGRIGHKDHQFSHILVVVREK